MSTHSLDPRRHADLARTLLRRQYGEEIAAFVHQQFLTGNATLTATIVGWDKYGPFEHPNGAMRRGEDQASAHDRASLSVHFTGGAVKITDTEQQSLRNQPRNVAQATKDLVRDAAIAAFDGFGYGGGR